MSNFCRQPWWAILLLVLLAAPRAFAQKDSDFPASPQPPRLVNDLAHVMSADEVALLEEKARAFADSTSNQISIVTITSIGDYDVSDYATQLGNRWGIGQKKRNNGVIILAAIKEHKINISVGKGLEGALTDLTSGRIIRNEMAPSFREGNYYRGFRNGLNAVMAATKGEYLNDSRGEDSPMSAFMTLAIIFVILIVLVAIVKGKGGGGGGTYMSRRGGMGGFGGGFLGGSMMGSGWGSGSSGWGGGSSGGGFGGFGGGSFGGGGASGGW